MQELLYRALSCVDLGWSKSLPVSYFFHVCNKSDLMIPEWIQPHNGLIMRLNQSRELSDPLVHRSKRFQTDKMTLLNPPGGRDSLLPKTLVIRFHRPGEGINWPLKPTLKKNKTFLEGLPNFFKKKCFPEVVIYSFVIIFFNSSPST